MDAHFFVHKRHFMHNFILSSFQEKKWYHNDEQNAQNDPSKLGLHLII